MSHQQDIEGWEKRFKKRYPEWCDGFVPLYLRDGCKPNEFEAFKEIEMKYNPEKVKHAEEWGERQANLIDGKHNMNMWSCVFMLGSVLAFFLFMMFMVKNP